MHCETASQDQVTCCPVTPYHVTLYHYKSDQEMLLTYFLNDAQKVTKFLGSVSWAIPMTMLPLAPSPEAVTTEAVVLVEVIEAESLFERGAGVIGLVMTSEKVVNFFFSSWHVGYI